MSELGSLQPIYGCEHVIDLMLLRGGIQIDWNEKESSSIMNGHVCLNHMKKLLTSWDSNSSHTKKNVQGGLVCSIPEILHEGGVRPLTARRLNKVDTLKMIAATGRFFHVGTAVCNYHGEVIQKQKFELLKFSKERSYDENKDFMAVGDLNESLSEIASNLSREKDPTFDNDDLMDLGNLSDSSQVIAIPPPPEAYRDSKKETSRILRELATQYGLSRLTGEKSWKHLKEDTRRKKAKKQTNDDRDDDDDKKFRCPEETCTAKYLTLKGLNDHILLGKHDKREYSSTAVEAAAKLFSDNVETNEDAYLSMKIDSFSTFLSTVVTQTLTEGWSIRMKKRNPVIFPAVRAAVKKYFIERRSIGQRAEAKFAVQMLKNAKNPDGDYTYLLIRCLKETQAQGLITRWLKIEASKGLKAVEDEGKRSNGGDEEEEEVNNEIEQIDCIEVIHPKKSRARSANASLERKKTIAKISQINKSTLKAKVMKKQNPGSSEGEKTDDEMCEEVEQPGLSTQIRRSTRTKKSSQGFSARNSSTQGRKTTKSDIPETDSTRVLRSGVSKEERVNYYDNEGSDVELDVFDAMMTTIHEHYEEIFTDSE